MFSPFCPACGKAIPLIKSLFGLGAPFQCLSCKTSLVVPKAQVGMGLVVYASASVFLRPMLNGMPMAFLLIFVFAAVLVQYLITEPKRVT